MKKLTLIISILISFFAAQSQKDTKFNLDLAAGSYSFSQTVAVQGTKESDLYIRANDWYANNLQSQKLQLWNDNKTGKIIGKGRFDIIKNNTYDLNYAVSYITFTCEVLIKDNKFKYIITDYKYSLTEYENSVRIKDYALDNTTCPICDVVTWNNIKSLVYAQTQLMVTSLNESMNLPSAYEISSK